MERIVVAHVGQQRLLPAAIGHEVDVTVDQAGKNGLGAEVDEVRRVRNGAGPRVTETMRPLSTTMVDGPRGGFPGTAISRPARI